jgi:hypothetical protein
MYRCYFSSLYVSDDLHNDVKLNTVNQLLFGMINICNRNKIESKSEEKESFHQ